jgi:glutamyl-tRNA reductase
MSAARTTGGANTTNGAKMTTGANTTSRARPTRGAKTTSGAGVADAPQATVHEEWLTLHEACSLVGVSPATLRRWSDNGDISSFTTPGGHRRFAKSALLDLLRTPCGAPPAASPAAPPAECPVSSPAESSAASPEAEAADPASDVCPVAAPGASSAAADGGAESDAPIPTLVAIVAQARKVPTAAREAFATELAALERNDAAIVVHTCHRVELYGTLEGLGDTPLPEPPEGAQRFDGVEAARHLVAVACGLDSAVLCENQILHQLRETLTKRRADHPLDPTIDRLFQVALQAGRCARSRFGGSTRSLADVALERVEERAGASAGKGILVVGAGVMGHLTALAAARKGAEVVVTSRTGERAAALAREVGGWAIPFGGGGVVPKVVGAIVELAGVWPLAEEDARALAESGAIVVDMSSPPAVPETLQAALGDRFVCADDLAKGEDAEMQDKLREQLEKLVTESVESYFRRLRTRKAGSAIQAIGEAADEQRRGELDWLFRRLPELAEKERSLIEQMSNRLVADILHAPRSALNSDDSGQLAQAARELFGA